MPNRKTVGARREFGIGAAIISHLPAVRTQRETAERLGISRSLVERIEKIAAYKIAMRMKMEVNYEMR